MHTPHPTILGAIAGDIIGSPYEQHEIKTTDFPLFKKHSDFTDDTVLTVAVADALLNNRDFTETLWHYGRRHIHRGYGGMFLDWLGDSDPQPYGSFGNGSAMRVSPVGFACDTLDEVLDLAAKSAEVTHNHTEGIKGAQAAATSVFLAAHQTDKQELRRYVERQFGYDLDFTLDEIRPHYDFDVTCQGSVPQAIVAFLESRDYEDAVRLAISIGGDSDTIACITGGIAAAYYKSIPDKIVESARERLPSDFLEIIDRFDRTYSRP
ncbi:MAG: ADP-ribosylglycohydrolase family protein [Cyclonatronaceae bacterium]